MANDMNFCPGCGQPLQPDTVFCPKCGRQIISETQPKQRGFSFSKLRESMKDLSAKAKESKIGTTVAGAASGIVSKVKDRVANINQWDGELVRTHPLTLPDNVSDQIVFKGKGGGILKGKFATFAKDGKIVLTRKSVQFYDVPFGKSLIPGKKHDASKLVHTINLADIDSIKKETNKLGMTSILVTAKGEVCDITAAKDPSRFLLFLTRLAGIEGNLLNIKLRENEKVIDTCNIEAKMDRWGVGWRNSTIYLTNQRIVINHGGDANEGWLLSYEIDREKIKEITEDKQAMNCLYTIISDGEPVVIKFQGIVPSWFLGMVKNGEGNAAQLKRKGNLMKGAKVALVAASLLGVAGDADADVDDDMDVDVDDDFDMDTDTVDLDGDGIDDTMMVDTDGDGMYDTAYIDTDGDGTFDSMAVDVDGDGTFDAIGMDTDGDGAIDSIAVDADGDGAMDTMAVDVDGDGTIDAVGMDTDGNGSIDTIAVDADGDGVMETTMVDVDGDGTIDAVGMDTDGDGAIDTMTVDTDGDGVMDTTMVDVDGDGTFDAVGMDTNGDGAIDTVGVDTDGDGTIDSIGVDTDGDGAIDTVGVDVDGNGSIDAVGVDIDGNGTIDRIGIDTNGDGAIDTIQ